MTYNVIDMVQSRTASRIITRGVVKALGFAGATTIGLLAPNTTVLIDQYMKRLDKAAAKKTLTYLKYRRLIEVKQKDGQQLYKLTAKGIDRFEKILIEELEVPVPRRWDKKWRLVLFDIPVTHRQNREQLLHKLRTMNFYMLQHSAWIHPFDCQKQIGVLLKHLDLERYVSLLVVETGNFTDHATAEFKRRGLLM